MKRALALALALVLFGAEAARGAPPGSGPPAAGGSTSVTLITGDRVSLDPAGRPTVVPGPGRERVRMLVSRVAGHLRVLPADAASRVADGHLDPRLFDVTTLLAAGYDDRRADLPLIVSGAAAGAARRARAAAPARELKAVGAVAVRPAKAALPALWKSDGRIWLDGQRKPTLDVSVPQIGAPAAWQAGLDGRGVTVAVLDTGVDASHPDLAGKVTAQQNFTEGAEDDRDTVGHGTHVASTIAGTGAASGGRYRGVAPGAELLDGKICAAFGCFDSWILAGMQWAAENGAAVVNMSLGGPDTPGEDPVEAAVRTLTDRYGTLFVVAAGNRGGIEPVSSPASADAALAVGAVDEHDALAGFSSRGPRVGDGGLKPDITAPGVDITAARSKDTGEGAAGDQYLTFSGTSMATPHVAGSAAILAQQHPAWRSARLKAALMGAARPTPGVDAYGQGAGRVDVARVIGQDVAADPPGLGFDRQLWPHADDTPQTRAVTYRNDGPAPVTLAVGAEFTGPDGRPAPAGMVQVSADAVTVPAGGTAGLSVTVDTRLGGADGHYSGRLVATAGAARVVTPVAVDREAESYDVTLSHTARSGGTPSLYDTVLVPQDPADGGPFYYEAFSTEPTGEQERLRVPRGRYTVLSQIYEADGPGASLLAQPRLDVTAPARLDVDARRAKPMSVRPPHEDLSVAVTVMSVGYTGPGNTAVFDVPGDENEPLFAGPIGDATPDPGFASQFTSHWAHVDADGQPDPRQSQYHGGWVRRGTVLDAVPAKVEPRDLAAVRAGYAVTAAGLHASTLAFATAEGFPPMGLSLGLEFAPPLERVDYFAGDPDVLWDREVDELAADTGEFLSYMLDRVRYRPGTVTRETWNRGVFGPGLVNPRWQDQLASRTGDVLLIAPHLNTDGAGRPGGAALASATTTVDRDGVRIAQESGSGGNFTVPPGRARYRVAISATRVPEFELSTRVDVAWGFVSGTAAGTVRLPLSTVRFSPAVDQRNTAPAGRVFPVPVTVVRQPGSAAAANRSLVVAASFDDGATWRRVPVVGGKVLVPHPRGAGFVSLRATAVDRAGNTVEQTVIRAYRIG